MEVRVGGTKVATDGELKACGGGPRGLVGSGLTGTRRAGGDEEREDDRGVGMLEAER